MKMLSKILAGAFGGFIARIILAFLQEYVLKFIMPDFMIGWICCMGCYIALEIKETLNKIKKEQ